MAPVSRLTLKAITVTAESAHEIISVRNAKATTQLLSMNTHPHHVEFQNTAFHVRTNQQEPRSSSYVRKDGRPRQVARSF